MITVSQLKQTIARTYRLGFGIIAIIITVFFGYNYYQITSIDLQPAIINIAGKQRMLSQRIALIESLLLNEPNHAKVAILKAELSSRAQEFADNHEILVGRQPRDNQLNILPAVIEEHYFGGRQPLDTQVRVYAERALRMASETDITRYPPLSIDEITELLWRLDKSVSLFEARLGNAFEKEKRLTILAYVLMLITMLITVFKLFRPVEKLMFEQHDFALDAHYDAAQQKREAREAAIAKQLFLARMSHEFRTPIASMIGALELLPNMLDKQKELTAKATQACHQLLSLTNNLVDTMASAEIQQERAGQPFDLIRLIDECISVYSYQCKQQGLTLSIKGSETLPQYVFGPPVALSKSIKNVLDNAVKFTHSGAVTVTLAMAAKDERNVITVTVTDTGPGIPTGEQPFIFDSFFRGEQARKNNCPGAGVGLGVAKLQLEANGGKLELVRSDKNGTTFMLSIGLQIAESEQTGVVARQPGHFAVIDDIEISRQHLSNLIKSQGFSVDTFSSGAELLTRQSDIKQYNGIVMDYFMPGLSGMELSTNLQAMYADAVPPIIFISATPDIANLVHGSNLQIWQTFVKPVDRNRFVDALHHLASSTAFKGVEQREADILVVEDEPINQEILKAMVENLGYKCWVASTAEEALNATLKRRFDVILLDINLPDQSGLQVAEQIRLNGTTTPLIAVTAHAYEADREATRLAGIRYHLIKPVAYQELRHTLKQALLIR